VRVPLTPHQMKQLAPYFDLVRAAAVRGNPGMLVAQISWNREGSYWLTPAFLDHELAKTITERARDPIGDEQK